MKIKSRNMKHLKKYQQFITENKDSQLNEEVLGWIKKKANDWLQKMRSINTNSTKLEDDTSQLEDNIGQLSEEDKKKQLTELIKIIPSDVMDVIKKEVEIAIRSNKSNESIEFLLEAMYDALLGNLPSDSEVEKMSDEEFDEYLRNIAKDKYFAFWIGDDDDIFSGKGKTQYEKFQRYLMSRGIDVNQDIMYKVRPSIGNINSKIDKLNISDGSKKALRIAALTLFFIVLSSKAVAGGLGHIDRGDDDDSGSSSGSFHDSGGAYMDINSDDGDSFNQSTLNQSDGDSVVGDDPKKDPRSLFDKISGKKVTTIHKTVTDKQAELQAKKLKLKSGEDYIKYLQDKEGWSLTKVKSDTIHKTLLMQKPDTMIQVVDLGFDIDGDQFLTGKFELNQDVKDNIESEIDLIMSKGGVITNYAIESSTDKEPIKMGNDVLAQKRADAVKKELSSIGVDDSLISIKTLPEQGPAIYTKTMSAKERDDARQETKDFRYVIVHILYYDKTVSITPEIKKEVDKVKSTYYLDKQKVYKPLKHHHGKGIKVHKHTKSFNNKGSGKLNVVKCWDPGSKSAWWNKLKP